MHGSRPSAAVAVLRDGTLTVHTHSQRVRDAARDRAPGRPVGKRVRLQHMAGSGCYGHNAADDAAADAAVLAMALAGRPVRMQWMREDEHVGAVRLRDGAKLKAGLAADGGVARREHALWSCSHGAPARRPARQPARRPAQRRRASPAGTGQRRAAELRRRPQRDPALRLPRPAHHHAFHPGDAGQGLGAARARRLRRRVRARGVVHRRAAHASGKRSGRVSAAP